ncbi:MAG: RnfABCDGE type electron transport complex subunit B, partial [Clostridia bacterium]|nr:RnfABCDGE type electron transport complex subunit B [Clostridia bacterium]
MMSILTALFVVGAVGLIAAVLLTLAAHFMHVEEDETAKQIRECLPGANCGACGYTGCDSYAQALADGAAKPNLCVPGGADIAGKLSEVLGVAVEASEAKVAFVHCNGNCEAAPKKNVYDGLLSCKAASMLYGGP